MELQKTIADAIIDYINIYYTVQKDDDLDYYEHANGVIKHVFTTSWKSGGTYGSCFTDGPVKVDPEDEPEQNALHEFLNYYFSDELSPYDIRTIENLSEIDEDSDSDYYGGCTLYSTKTLSLLVLAEHLNDLLYYENDPIVNFNDLLFQQSSIIPGMTRDEYLLYKERLLLKKDLEQKLSNTKETTQKMKI